MSTSSTPRSRAAIYVRISQDREGAGLGVGRQQADCEALAARLGVKVGRVYVDNDLSAYSGKPRPEYLEMLRDIENGRIDLVIAWHTDRLHRTPSELEKYIEVTSNAPTHTVKAGEIDLATPGGRAVARTLGAWARYESEHKSERITRKNLEKAQNGEYHGGVSRPFGFEADGVTHRTDEADEVRTMTNALIAGDSIGSIIRDLNSRGVKSVRGNSWSYVTVRALLLRPRNAGLRQYRGEVIGKASWEPIVSPSVFDVATRILNDPSRRTTKNSGRRHLLSGIAKCGVCGLGMKSGGSKTRTGAPFKVYRCCTTRNMEKLDEYIEWVATHVLLNQPWDKTRLPDPDVAHLQAEVDQIEMDMIENARSRAAGKISLGQLETLNEIYTDRLAALHEEIAHSSPRPWKIWVGFPGDITFSDLGNDRKRLLVRTLLDIEVMPVGKGSNKRGVAFEDGVKVTPIGDYVHTFSNLDEGISAVRLTDAQARIVLRAFAD